MTKSISQLNSIANRNGSERVYVSRLSDTVTITDTSISALAADNSLNDANGNFNTIGLLEGHRVKITGFTNTANNIESAVVTEITANKITFGGTDGDVIVDEIAGNSITISKWESVKDTYIPDTSLQTVDTLAELKGSSGVSPLWFDGIGYKLASGDFSAEIAADDVGQYVKLDSIPASSAALVAQGRETLTDKQFGITGSGDETASFQRLLDVAASFDGPTVVKLLNDNIDFSSVIVPSGVFVIGNGRKRWNRTSSEWQGKGTLLTGTISFTGARFAGLTDCSIDTYTKGTNSVTGLSQTTEGIIVERVNTRANNHGQLWEQNSSLQDGSEGGYISVTDCNHYGGPNGMVSKMRDVTFTRCYCYDFTTQGFVAVSDNINGATTYSRAINTRFIDCGGGGSSSKTLFRVYSRDEYSTTNANNVQPATNIKWIRGEISGCSEHGAHIGDFYQSSPTRTQLLSSNISIEGAAIANNGLRGVIITLGNKVRIDNNVFGSNGDKKNIAWDTTDGRVTNLNIGDGNRYVDSTPQGQESRIETVAVNSGTINVSHGAKILYKTANTATTVISAVAGASQSAGDVYRILIDDDYTTVNLGGSSFVGKGVLVELFYDSVNNTFKALGKNQFLQAVAGYSSSLSLVYDNGVTAREVAVNGGVTSISATLPDSSFAGNSYIANLYAGNAGGKSLAGWGGEFKFSTENPSPSLIPDGSGVLIEFYFDGSSLIVKSINTYTL